MGLRGIDHGVNYPKPTQYNDTENTETWYHNTCGEQIKSRGGGYFYTSFHCDKCKETWTPERLRRFTAADLAARFHLRPKFTDGVTLVEKTEGRNRFMTLVPNNQAHLYKKVKLP